MKIIESLFLFKDLTDAEKKKLVAKLEKPISFKKGDTIYSAEVFSNAIGFVIKGTATAVTNNSEGIYMKSFTEGNVFGAAAIFGNEERYISTIIAKTDMEILFISEETLKYFFALCPKTALNYISFLSDKVRFLNKKLNMISCPTAEDTVFNYLCSIKNSENIAKLPVSVTLLSKMLGLGRASLYRSFEALEKEGKIKRENNIIKVIKNEKNS